MLMQIAGYFAEFGPAMLCEPTRKGLNAAQEQDRAGRQRTLKTYQKKSCRGDSGQKLLPMRLEYSVFIRQNSRDYLCETNNREWWG